MSQVHTRTAGMPDLFLLPFSSKQKHGKDISTDQKKLAISDRGQAMCRKLLSILCTEDSTGWAVEF